MTAAVYGWVTANNWFIGMCAWQEYGTKHMEPSIHHHQMCLVEISIAPTK